MSTESFQRVTLNIPGNVDLDYNNRATRRGTTKHALMVEAIVKANGAAEAPTPPAASAPVPATAPEQPKGKYPPEVWIPMVNTITAFLSNHPGIKGIEVWPDSYDAAALDAFFEDIKTWDPTEPVTKAQIKFLRVVRDKCNRYKAGK